MDILALMRERSGDYDCPKCRVALTGCSLAMLRDEDPQYTVQVTCASCHVTFVVVLQVRDRSSSAVPQPATPAEPAAPPISPDEVLDLHQLLRSHRGPLTDLLQGRPTR